jgi:chromosome segregation ATPase
MLVPSKILLLTKANGINCLSILESKCDHLEILKSQDDSEELEVQRNRMRASAVKRGRHILEINRIQRDACNAFQERTVANLAILQYTADLNVQKNLNAETENRIKDAERVLRAMEDEFKRSRNRQKELIAKAQENMRKSYGEDQDKINQVLELSKTPLETLEESLATYKGRAQLIQVDNPGIVEEFQTRKREVGILFSLAFITVELNHSNIFNICVVNHQIEALEARFAERESKLTKACSEIARLREKWESQVDGMVAKISEAFSTAFSNIGCTGEVDLGMFLVDFLAS